MNTHMNSVQKKKDPSFSEMTSIKKEDGKSTFQFNDRRPEAYRIHRLQQMVDNNSKIVQRKAFQKTTNSHTAPKPHFIQRKENKTGLPNGLKSGIEQLSGYSMDDVRVHYNSDRPAQLQAHAYAQGTDIHLGKGQEKHLPHEAWHVVQQKQGRVRATRQMKGSSGINDDVILEKEADIMGAKALQLKSDVLATDSAKTLKNPSLSTGKKIVQRIKITEKNVVDDVWQVFLKLGSEAKFLLKAYKDFHAFFILPAAEQIRFLTALDHSTTVINTLIERKSMAIMGSGPNTGQDALQELQLQFLELNPDFLQNLLQVTQGHTGVFHFSTTDSISVGNFAAFRSPDPRKALLGPDEKALTKDRVQWSQISIHSVMREKNLSRFLHAQQLFQAAMRSMDDLKSVGFEFEFASFTDATGVYTEHEIIPSHQLMARAAVGENYFGLSWRLESDSKNTLELVSPPFVFSRDTLGEEKSDNVKKKLKKTVGDLADKMNFSHGTLPQTTSALSSFGIGHDWKVGSRFQNFHVISNKKSGGKVYAQANVSLYPHEIGALLEGKFNAQDKRYPANTLAVGKTSPVNVAQLVRNHFLANLPKEHKPSDAVKHAIAVFSRYASNALAIPSFRHRQVTGTRKDAMPTTIKETLEVWVKTDPLNLLKHLLKDPADQHTFHIALAESQEQILGVFDTAGKKFVTDAQHPEPIPPTILEIKTRMDRLIQQNPAMAQNKLTTMQLAKQQLIHERTPIGPDPSVAVAGYAVEMMEDVGAYITRALNVDKHKETDPKMTTSEFLHETFGKGEGIRKGTYLKGVPTSKGPMYVTELR